MNLTDEEKSICIVCGKCCTCMTFTVMNDPRLVEFYTARGCTLHFLGNQMAVVIPHICPHLTEGEGCDCYDERPDLCRLYDGRNDKFLDCPLKQEKTNDYAEGWK